jgi:hypothetical protein
MPEFKTEEETRDPARRGQGLTTADLANLDEPTSAERDKARDHEINNRDREINRAELPERESRASDDPITDRSSAVRANPKIQTNESTENDENKEAATPLFSAEESNGFHARWDAIQVSFVDEPREAVQQADGLVASAMKRLAEIFAEERGRLDQQWDRGGDVSTEDLRIALRRYRSFFGRLLSV